jgi:hypothetical protein
MTDLPPTRTLAENRARYARLENAEKGPRANLRTRVALVAHDRRLTKKQLAKFRKGNRFNFVAFATAHDVSLDWLIDGELRMHPRKPAAIVRKPEMHRALSPQEFREVVQKLDERDRRAIFEQMERLVKSEA